MAGRSERALLCRLDLSAEAGRHVGEMLDVGGDSGALHRGQHANQGKFDLREELAGSALGEVGVQRVRELRGRKGALCECLCGFGLPCHVERQLTAGGRIAAQLAPGVAQRQVGQIE